MTAPAPPIHQRGVTTSERSSADARRALRVLRIAATATFVLAMVLLTVMPARPVTANVPGFGSPVLGFELASTPAHVFGILGAPGAPERAEMVRRMDLGNEIDFAFMMAYPALYVGITLLLMAHGRVRGPVAIVMLVLPVLMWLGDTLENRQLLVLSSTVDPNAMPGPLATLGMWTRVKWYAIFVESALAAAFVWRETGWWRWSAVPFAIGALVGLASVAYLPAIEVGVNILGVAWAMTLVRSYQR